MVKLIIISTILLCILFPIFCWLGMYSKRKNTQKIWHDDEYGDTYEENSDDIKLVIGGSGSGKTRYFLKPNLMPTEKFTER